MRITIDLNKIIYYNIKKDGDLSYYSPLCYRSQRILKQKLYRKRVGVFVGKVNGKHKWVNFSSLKRFLQFSYDVYESYFKFINTSNGSTNDNINWYHFIINCLVDYECIPEYFDTYYNCNKQIYPINYQISALEIENNLMYKDDINKNGIVYAEIIFKYWMYKNYDAIIKAKCFKFSEAEKNKIKNFNIREELNESICKISNNK